MIQTPSRDARLAAGLPLAEAARRLNIKPRTLARCEAAQDWPLGLAEEAAILYRTTLAPFQPTADAARRRRTARRRLALTRSQLPTP